MGKYEDPIPAHDAILGDPVLIFSIDPTPDGMMATILRATSQEALPVFEVVNVTTLSPDWRYDEKRDEWYDVASVASGGGEGETGEEAPPV